MDFDAGQTYAAGAFVPEVDMPDSALSTRCPHCQTVVFAQVNYQRLTGTPAKTFKFAASFECPACSELVSHLLIDGDPDSSKSIDQHPGRKELIWPRRSNRPPAPQGLDESISGDYDEACLVLDLSPKASAALSRRCLQSLLRRYGKVKPGRLVDEINQVESGSLPSHLSAPLHALRQIGNFSAHETKDTHAGEIVDVEPEEAEWNLEVLEGLFDFYVTVPARERDRIERLNFKLESAGKPTIPVPASEDEPD